MAGHVLLLTLLVAALVLWPPAAPPWGRPRRRPRDAAGDGTVDDAAAAMVLLAAALRAPVGLAEAVEAVAEVATGPVRADLRSVAAARRWGVAAEESWSYASPVWEPVAHALRLAERTGAAPAGLVAEAAGRIGAGEARRRQRAAARAATVLVVPLGLLFLPAFAATTVLPAVFALTGRLVPLG